MSITFGMVVEWLQETPKGRAYREGWCGVMVAGVGSMFIEYRAGKGDVFPHLILHTPAGIQMPWLPTSADIFLHRLEAVAIWECSPCGYVNRPPPPTVSLP